MLFHGKCLLEFENAVIQTRGYWVGSANSTSVLCSPQIGQILAAIVSILDEYSGETIQCDQTWRDFASCATFLATYLKILANFDQIVWSLLKDFAVK